MRAAQYFCLLAIHLMSCGGAPSPAPHPPATTRTSAPLPAASAVEPARPRSPVVGIPTYVPQAGHSGEITALAWNRAGSLIATSSKQEGVKLWAMPEGAAIAELQTRDTDPADMAFSPDGHSLAVANWNGALEIWDLGELRPRVTHRDHKGSVQSLAYTPDGALLLSGGEDGTIQVYETRSQKLRGLITGMPAAVYTMAFSPDGKRLACSAGSKVQIRETGTWRPLRALEAHQKPVTSVAWSPDGRSIATGGEDGLVIVWDAEKGTASGRIEAGAGVEMLSWSARGDLVSSELGNGTVRVWSASTRAKVREWTSERLPGLLSLSESMANDDLRMRLAKRIGVAAEERFVSWKPRTDSLWMDTWDHKLDEVDIDGLKTATAAWWSQGILGSSLSRDGARFAVWTKDCKLRVADTRDGRAIASRALEDLGLPKMELSPSGEPIAALPELALSPDGKQLALFDASAGLRLWQVGGAGTRRISDSVVSLAAWSADGATLAYYGDDWKAGGGNAVRLWSVSGSRLLGALSIQAEPVDIEFRPDGKQVAAAERDTGRIRIYDLGTRHELSVLEGPVRSGDLAYSPDGRWLAASGDSGIRIWDAQTWKLKQSLERASGHLSWHRGSKVIALDGELPMLLRVDDGEALWIEAAGEKPTAFVFATDGLFDGTPSDSSIARFRIGTGVVDFGLITASQLPVTYKHPGLLREFLEGHPLPHPQAGVAAQPH